MPARIDQVFMREALSLADRGRRTTWPNPRVGALVVCDGRVMGRGYHEYAGGPHAEIHALLEAGRGACGATVYVTLEPCSSRGRTGPCVEALVAAGVKRVVMAMTDPDPRHRGRAIGYLRERGVVVETGCLEAEARALNAPFLRRVEMGRPLITAKLGMSMDGRVAYSREAPGWFTGPEARVDTHRLRSEHPLLVTGLGTVVADDPELTVREYPEEPGHGPVRLVVDSHAGLPPGAKILAGRGAGGEVWVACLEGVSEERARLLEDRGVRRLVRCPADETGRVDLRYLAGVLGREFEFNAAWLECGPTLMGAFLDAGLIDRWVAYFAPLLVGGGVALPAILGRGARDGFTAPRLGRADWVRVGRDWRLTAELEYGG